ncbi:MAG TPA: hypothetical protein VK074_04980 [Fodinibius sp.]|nr:hypothetical protein [Fodinibius sp.]
MGIHIGFVTKEGLLIVADQFFGLRAIVAVGRGEARFANQF